MTTFAAIGKAIVAAKNAGKSLDSVPLGKFAPHVASKRKVLAKAIKKSPKSRRKAMDRHPEKFSIFDVNTRKILGPRGNYKKGGKTKGKK
jgi:hypothetical protein|tara:strand:- start:123 stop:392 length:270 start_codon:yes stop_codon:yes gene_type:complete